MKKVGKESKKKQVSKTVDEKSSKTIEGKKFEKQWKKKS
jgi:hypothetical protein